MLRKILFLANYRQDRAPGQRYRFEQYLPSLIENSFEPHLSSLFKKEEEPYIHRPGHYFRKLLLTFNCFFRRARDLTRIKRFSVLFVYREALFFGPPIFEWIFQFVRIPRILDFDDAIWLYDLETNFLQKLLRNPKKIKTILPYFDLVIVGNDYLAQFCRQNGARRVEIIPSTINTDLYVPKYLLKQAGETVVIGWTGSPSTIQHFQVCLGVLRKLKDKFGDKIAFRLIGDPSYRVPDLGIQGIPWVSETEVADLRPIDIGIMPLPDEEWTQGKCGMKGLQYMALEIPTVMSPVGANKTIIQDGSNGFLAASDDEWIQKLTQLIENPELRLRLGREGRKTVLERYSVSSQKDFFVSLIESVLA